MKPRFFLSPVVLCLAAITCTLAAAQPSAKSTATGQATAKIVAAANDLLATLDQPVRARLRFEFKNDTQRRNWSNLPTGIYQRAGLRMGDLTSKQRDAVMAVLAAALSPEGYRKILEIVAAEELLKKDSNDRLKFGADEFYVSVLGEPSTIKPWMLQFGGHHLALNVTIVGSEGILTPSHTAAQPASYTLEGKTIRPLGAENDLAFALVNALDPAQRKTAILSYEIRDIVLGPGHDGETIAPEGLMASEMNSAQQAQLLGLIHEWVGIIHTEAAAGRMAEVKANLPSTYFAWSGSTTNGHPAYFRIQGPTLLIEYAPQSVGGVLTNHIHTIYRDPKNDYGKKLLAQ